MRAAIWFLLPSDGTFLRDSYSLRYYLARQGLRAVLRGGDVTGWLWENRLNWIPDPAPATSRDHGIKQSPLPEGPKEEEVNRPSASHPSRIPRKIRPRRRKRTHQKQHLPGTNEISPGIDLRPRWMKRTPQKHPQHPQHPQHPLPVTANENSPGLIPGTRLILAGFISRLKEAGSSNPANDLVETTSPGHHSCSTQSGLVETTSPRPRQGLAKALLLSYCFSHRPVEVIPSCHQLRLSLKEELSPSVRATATRCPITCSHSHAQLILILY